MKDKPPSPPPVAVRLCLMGFTPEGRPTAMARGYDEQLGGEIVGQALEWAYTHPKEFEAWLAKILVDRCKCDRCKYGGGA